MTWRIEARLFFFAAVITILSCFAFQKAIADDLGYTIKDTETLYQSCKTAVEEYKDKAQEIGSSVCGAYIVGIMTGYVAAAITIFSKMPEKSRTHYYEEFFKDNCLSIEKIYFHIQSFVNWREKNKDFNDSPLSAFFASVYQSDECLAQGVDFNRKWEKYDGKN